MDLPLNWLFMLYMENLFEVDEEDAAVWAPPPTPDAPPLLARPAAATADMVMGGGAVTEAAADGGAESPLDVTLLSGAARPDRLEVLSCFEDMLSKWGSLVTAAAVVEWAVCFQTWLWGRQKIH